MDTRQRDIFIACSVGDLDWLERSITGCEMSIGKMVNHEGLTPLHVAAKFGHVAVLQYLLDNCPNINPDIATYDQGETPLHYCLQVTASSCIVQCVRLLLDRGVNSNKTNKNAQTAIHIAAENGLTPVVKMLLSHGANDTVKDMNNRTPLDLAKLNGHYECARLLQALYWAHQKDTAAQTKLHVQRTLREQMRVQVALQEEIKQHKNKLAYKEWLDNKRIATPKIMCNPQKKKETVPLDKGKVSSSHFSRLSSGAADSVAEPQTTISNQLNPDEKTITVSKIEISLNQAEHNVLAVGKPDKLYPYSNYPSKPYRRHRQKEAVSLTRPSSSMSGKQHGYKRQRCSSRMSAKSVPTPRDGGSTPTPSTRLQPDSLSLPPSYVDYSIHKPNKDIHEHTSPSPNGNYDNKLEEEQEEEDGEGSGSSIDGLTFHEVGPENDLQTLIAGEQGTQSPAVPIMTTTALFELFRLSHEDNSSSYPRLSRRHSTGTRFRSRQSCRYQRAISLSAIPEGEIVTKYDENDGGSRVFDESFLSSLMPYAFGKDTKNELEGQLEGQLEATDEDQLNETEEDISSLVIATEPDPPFIDTLKVVTVAWGDEANEVKTLKLEEKKMSPTRVSSPSLSPVGTLNASIGSQSDTCLASNEFSVNKHSNTTKVRVKSAFAKSTTVRKNKHELLQRDANRHSVLKTTLYKFGGDLVYTN